MDRLDRINQQMKREVSDIIQKEIVDPHWGLVSITSVDVSRDLRHARASFSVLGDESKIEMITNTLNHASGYIRKLVGQRIRMRYTPEILFIYDHSLKYGAEIEQKLEDIRTQVPGRPFPEKPE